MSLPYRVDVYCSGGWQHRASFAEATDAYEYGSRYSVGAGARVWCKGKCIAITYRPLGWHEPRHNRNCNGEPCECGEVPPIGSMALRKEES